jgi:hypothetical protein
MTRILLMATASPARVRRKAEEILEGSLFGAAELIILCRGGKPAMDYFRDLPGVELISWDSLDLSSLRKQLNARGIDVLYVFWTGEGEHRIMKIFPLAIRAGSVTVDIGDGGAFRLTWKAIVRHALFRRNHPLPTDYWEFLPPPQLPASPAEHPGEQILIVQSAPPHRVLQALERLRQRPLFRDPRYTIFCRNRLDDLQSFRDPAWIHEVWSHTEARGWWRHLLELRRRRFDAVVLFLTGDPGYWKIKIFAFLLGAHHKLVFNENCDCFFFSWSAALGLLSHRLGERSRLGHTPRGSHHSWLIGRLLVKGLLLPFRFGWLLMVWLRLRCTALVSRHEEAPF